MGMIKKFVIGLAFNSVRKVATIDKINESVRDSVDMVLQRITAKVAKDKLEKSCKLCANISSLTGNIASAIEDGEISEEEYKKILADISSIFSKQLTQYDINNYLDILESRIIERFG